MLDTNNKLINNNEKNWDTEKGDFLMRCKFKVNATLDSFFDRVDYILTYAKEVTKKKGPTKYPRSIQWLFEKIYNQVDAINVFYKKVDSEWLEDYQKVIDKLYEISYLLFLMKDTASEEYLEDIDRVISIFENVTAIYHNDKEFSGTLDTQKFPETIWEMNYYFDSLRELMNKLSVSISKIRR